MTHREDSTEARTAPDPGENDIARMSKALAEANAELDHKRSIKRDSMRRYRAKRAAK